jgi:hypothetical protein
VRRLVETGTDSVVFQPLDSGPAFLEKNERYLLPLLKNG